MPELRVNSQPRPAHSSRVPQALQKGVLQRKRAILGGETLARTASVLQTQVAQVMDPFQRNTINFKLYTVS
jgi:hypothetical protein